MSSEPTRAQREALRLLHLGYHPLQTRKNNPSGYAMLDRMRRAGLIQGFPPALTDKGRAIVETAEQKEEDKP
jgi:hypothetical protein